MTSEKRAQKFHTDDASYPYLSSASYWSCLVGNLIQPIRSTTQIWVVTRHLYGISHFWNFNSGLEGTLFQKITCWVFHILTLLPGKWRRKFGTRTLFYIIMGHLTTSTERYGFKRPPNYNEIKHVHPLRRYNIAKMWHSHHFVAKITLIGGTA